MTRKSKIDPAFKVALVEAYLRDEIGSTEAARQAGLAQSKASTFKQWVDIYQNEVFVFTPKGDVITLPKGATLIDFAYAIHSQVGNRMVGAKVNGIICPIDRSPQNGDLVEILTSAASKGPSRDWLGLVKTGEARNKIRQWFKKEKKAENILVGRGELEKEFKYFLENADLMKDECLIPNTVGKMMKDGTATVKAYSNKDKWYGITYREDKEEVQKAIAELCEKGLYEGI